VLLFELNRCLMVTGEYQLLFSLVEMTTHSTRGKYDAVLRGILYLQ
jgi:hypothetical protein